MATFSKNGTVRGRNWSCAKPCAPICPIMPLLPDQGGVMPVLWQPTVQTSYANLALALPALYTLNIITTQIIEKGVFLRFQIYDGQNFTYAEAVDIGGLVEFDLVIITEIPAGTVCVVSITQTGTQLYGFTGTTVYASGGASVPAPFFGTFMSCLCFAFVPTPSGSWYPSRGQPMFAIGFNHPSQIQGGSANGSYCIDADPIGRQITAPNFPDQYAPTSIDPRRWTFDYEVVYPIAAPEFVDIPLYGIDIENCKVSLGIKYLPIFTSTLGSWSTARNNITQPSTVIKNNYISVSRWERYSATEALDTNLANAAVGPFNLSAMAGQLVPVYWKPIYKNINTDKTPIGPDSAVYGSPAAIGLLITSPLQPNQTLYFTNQEYNAKDGGFGPRATATGGASFVYTNPAFKWKVGSRRIDAGTVVYIGNIGTNDIYIQNAHDSSANVGVIVDNLTNGESVESLICMGVWDSTGNGSSTPIFEAYFVCAALSDQYAGNMPPLSPCLTIYRSRFIGQVIYGMGRTFDNKGLPATVQAPLINSAIFTQLSWDTVVVPTDLPAFVGMQDFSW